MNFILKEIAEARKQITFSHIAVSFLSVIIFFILPCVVIGNFTARSTEPKNQASGVINSAEAADTNTQSQSVAEPKVAGATSTDEVISIPFLNITFNLNSQSGLFIIFGLILIAISIILFLYLYMDKDYRKYKKFKY